MSTTEEKLQSMASRYRPTVNILRAPALALPLPLVVVAWLLLMLDGVTVMLSRYPIAEGEMGRHAVVLAVHLFTLGWLTLTITGLLYQWIPVVFDVAPVAPRQGLPQALTYVVGLALFLAGWSFQATPLVEMGGVLLSVGLLWFTLLQVIRIRASTRPKDAVTAGVAASLVGLNLTWMLGLSMATGLLPVDGASSVLAVHISTAAAGFAATLVLSVEQKLVPMFTMSSHVGKISSWAPLTLVWLGLALVWVHAIWPAAVLWTGAGIWALVRVQVGKRTAKTPESDPVLWAVQMGWLLWIAAGILSALYPVFGFLAFACGAMTFILGYQTRLLPFILAAGIARKLPSPPQKAFFIARGLGSAWAPRSAAVLPFLTVLLLAAGILGHSSGLVLAAGAALMVTVMSHLALLVSRMARGRTEAMERLRAGTAGGRPPTT